MKGATETAVQGLDFFSAFATDPAKETEGVDVPIGGGTVLKIARAGNPKFEALLTRELELHQMELETLLEAEAKALDAQIFRKVIAQTVLIGWVNGRYKGEPLPYTHENAERMLEIPDFRALVMKYASRIDLFRVKQEARGLKK